MAALPMPQGPGWVSGCSRTSSSDVGKPFQRIGDDFTHAVLIDVTLGMVNGQRLQLASPAPESVGCDRLVDDQGCLDERSRHSTEERAKLRVSGLDSS